MHREFSILKNNGSREHSLIFKRINGHVMQKQFNLLKNKRSRETQTI